MERDTAATAVVSAGFMRPGASLAIDSVETPAGMVCSGSSLTVAGAAASELRTAQTCFYLEGSDACSATGEDSPDTIIVCIGWIWTFWASRVGNRTRTAPFASMSSTVSLQDLNEVTASVIF